MLGKGSSAFGICSAQNANWQHIKGRLILFFSEVNSVDNSPSGKIKGRKD